MFKLFTDSVSEYVQDNEAYIIDMLKLNDIDPTFKAIDDEAQNQIDDELNELKQAAQYFDNVGNYDSIVVYACLGLWYGQRTGKKTFKTLTDVLLKYCEDQNTFYFKTKKSTLTLAASHHDGINVFKFYYMKNGKKYAINQNIFLNGY